ncbi:patatin-like phospholipase family protein [Winogradskyella bathintestinalis]|uniref:Patatin-like phospholipase family protein n=1 Tax=Winogradskyella bathintestinalis TaxID=3035208 RepID=A0ABT7ZS28_9FLAO|nr:patatin-like phospholipase family protein [Winogradskyella bathintestinalis]MDN3491782.1 patatin-like phospholipase family protein [Winogradskyella bathintestinalis]
MKIKSLILILLLFSLLPVKAQDSTAHKQPKVGLVLSGGGAKGFAHIGVLKVIDSLGLKIDYVAGTSMGAIIGSLYASGYSGKQLEQIFKIQDFDELINDNFPRQSKPFYERENTEKYAVTLPFDKFRISLPSALSRGQNVYNLLYQLLQPVNGTNDFSQLPIPFFCMTTNIETGESVLLEKGKLAEAVTASGALPSLFQPVGIDGNIFIDGGVTNNFPVEELRAKGIDIIIGVDVQDALRDRESLKSAPDILLQINNFRTIDAMKSKAELTDIYIKPDITDFSVISFDEGENIIANGAAAARTQLSKLLDIKQKQPKYKERSEVKILDSLKINEVNIEGNQRYTRSYLIGKLKLKGDKKISYSDFRRGINNLIATNNFDTFRYYLENTENEFEYNLLGNITETRTSTFLRLGLHYDELYKSAILANITQKKLLFNNDITSLDIILGDNTRYNFDYFIDKGFYISIGVKSRYNQFNKNVSPVLALEEGSPLTMGINKIDAKISDFTNQLYLQTIFRKDFALRIGAEHKHLKITSETIIDDNQEDKIVFENTDYLSVFGNLKFDDYDNSYFPKNGFYFNGDFHLYLSASGFNKNFKEFSIAKADLGYAFSFSDKLALKTEASGGFKIGDKSTNALGFGIGGYGANYINNFYSFYGYDYLALIGDSFVKATFTLDYEIFKKHHIILAANIANIDDGLFESGQFFSSPDYSGYAIGYSLETFLGPLEAKYSYSPETGDDYWYFNLGFWF